ncbi:hypothetical protein [Streptomyces broussonetiae]|uniref:Uncharacterized protein n=1 Tax=Streptomyces broussonetiae TaxID=2686304 RepID=A0ABV5E5N2_9ACTN
MPQPTRPAALHEAGDAWLADCSPHPDLTRAAWEAQDLAPIASGPRWLVAESTLTDGMPAATRIRDEQRGPILADGIIGRAWWLVPTQAAEDLADVPHLTVHAAGWVLACPPMDTVVDGRFWLWRPDGSGYLTDPAVLAAAFGPGWYRCPAEAS